MPAEMTVFELFVKDLRCAHNPFRRGFDIIIKTAPSVPAAEIPDFMGYCYAMMESVNGHHHLEDDVVFPFVSQKINTSGWESDHVELTRRIEAVNAMVKEYTATPAKYDAVAFGAAIASMRDMLIPHLDSEEKDLSLKFLEENYTEDQVRELREKASEHSRTHGDSTITLPFLVMHTAPEDRPWPPAPWFVRTIILPWVLYPKHKRYVDRLVIIWGFEKVPLTGGSTALMTSEFSELSDVIASITSTRNISHFKTHPVNTFRLFTTLSFKYEFSKTIYQANKDASQSPIPIRDKNLVLQSETRIQHSRRAYLLGGLYRETIDTSAHN
ncbi:hypothetical protein BC938DRAFT_481065 [Jimgerdemannia flammicorona]|uniref:Hemerythrin-like domain-containing protein n=1 Tax=Jimgerdemannia flammicorona TaxID=994334 RepID=A0A433QHS6_9FUNG|nr:hypothetical protein BC938DRAFT_481065 [Jimgerdemannia flammicorona]